MSKSPAEQASVEEVRNYLAAEIELARTQLKVAQWRTFLVGVSDQGEIAASPCSLVLPFQYPATIAELDDYPRDHFSFPEGDWGSRRRAIPEFAEQHEIFSALDDHAESVRASDNHKRRRIQVLQDACTPFDPALTFFGIESDTETWWEVNTFHISGPRIPSPPAPVSDAQVLARLCRHTHSYVGQSRFQIENEAIVEVSFDGADTTDGTIDLLRGILGLRELLSKLKRMSLQHTLVTNRSLRFLERELPHVEIAYSHYLQG
ncbi:MAG TPA: hypothetical protein VKY92_08435 [Verrucomicrobiae bacterium]|nr:hypothetical protein [Verrucomicrobiae bacterium]